MGIVELWRGPGPCHSSLVYSGADHGRLVLLALTGSVSSLFAVSFRA